MEKLNLSPKTKEMIERYEKRCPVCGSLDCMRHSAIAREFLRKKEESLIFQTIPLMEAFINKKETKEMAEKILNNAFEYFKNDAEQGQKEENPANAAYALRALAAFHNPKIYEGVSPEQKKEIAQLITKELLNNVFENFKSLAEEGQKEGDTANAALALRTLAGFYSLILVLKEQQKKEESAKRDEELLAKVPTPEIRRYPPTPKKIL